MSGSTIRPWLAATMFLSTVAAGGCGLGPGDAAEGQASLTVTRDYGAEVLTEATLDGPTPADTVVRFLDESAEIDTTYGGNFVSTIDGLAGSTVDGGPEDWFFFVNGIYSELGAGEANVNAGDRIWWDYRRWSEAYRVPAVVGSFPEPFLHGYDERRPGVLIECLAEADECEAVAETLRAAGVEPETEAVDAPTPHPDDLRVLVGPWDRLRADPAARMLEDGPGTSGVYADLDRCGADGDWQLAILGSDAQPRRVIEEGGFVAAVRSGTDAPTFLVAGTDAAATPDAVSLFDGDSLRDRYGVAADAGGGGDLAMPAPDRLPAIETCP